MSGPLQLSPLALWQQACDEHGQGTPEQRVRYLELMREHGHLISGGCTTTDLSAPVGLSEQGDQR